MLTTSVRCLAASAVGVVLVLGAAGCDGDQPTSAGSPASSPTGSPTGSPPSSSPSVTASSTPTPTPTPSPLSRFEDRPAVQGARAWSAAIAHDVNNKDSGFGLAGPLSTPRGRTHLSQYEGDDIAKGRTMPGPLPFTPVSVGGSATTVTVRTCFEAKGWARDPAGTPQSARSISGVSFQVIKSSAGVWQVNALYTDDAVRCAGVKVRGVRF